MDDLSRALAFINAAAAARNFIDESKAAEFKDLYPDWVSYKYYHVGDRFNYDGFLYKVRQDHQAYPHYTPDITASLYDRILPGQDGTAPGVWELIPGSNGYMKGDKVYFPTMEDHLYESKYDNNVHSPSAWPEGWTLIG